MINNYRVYPTLTLQRETATRTTNGTENPSPPQTTVLSLILRSKLCEAPVNVNTNPEVIRIVWILDNVLATQIVALHQRDIEAHHHTDAEASNIQLLRPRCKPLPPRAGYHFVRVTDSVSNIGKHALCAQISAVLETTFNLQSYASVYLDGHFNHSVHEMLPGEQENLDFTFDVKDGVPPLTLIVKQGKRQGCSTKEPLPVYDPQGRIPITSIAKAKQETSQ